MVSFLEVLNDCFKIAFEHVVSFVREKSSDFALVLNKFSGGLNLRFYKIEESYACVVDYFEIVVCIFVGLHHGLFGKFDFFVPNFKGD